jgi:hypothetical protein
VDRKFGCTFFQPQRKAFFNLIVRLEFKKIVGLGLSFYGNDRGDGSFDYDCNGIEEVRWPSAVGACTWNWVHWRCDHTPGWKSAAPSCGESGGWITGCEYDEYNGIEAGCVEVITPQVQECR